jgi:hypothetical protein
LTRWALAAAERCRLLADLDVAQAHFGQHRHLVADRRDGLEESTASSTVMSSTSAIDLPLCFTSSVSRL